MVELTAELAIAALRLPGVGWSGDLITFSVPKEGSTWPGYGPGSEPFTGYGVLNQLQAQSLRRVMAAYDEIIAPRIEERDDLVSPGDIRAALSTQPPGAWAHWPPAVGNTPWPSDGDVWTNPFLTGGDYFDSFLHEVGHALGLKHPRDNPDPLPVELQQSRYSVMGGTETPGDYSSVYPYVEEYPGNVFGVGGGFARADGPMVADIAALQAIYGADPNTRSGDTVYRFDPSKPFLHALYDAGGVDTFDLSDHTRRSVVDLTPGAYSSIAIWTNEEQAAYYKARYPSYNWDPWFSGSIYTFEHNLGIAFSTTIENVQAGSGDDTLIGNAAANLLSGNAGADSIFGAGGDDTISGGAGLDLLDGGDGLDVLSFEGAAAAVVLDLSSGSVSSGDRITGFEGAIGTAFADSLTGSAAADQVSGGAGADQIYGGTGDDTLNGGDGQDYLRGDEGNDSISGGADFDDINGNMGDDLARGGDGNDWVVGGKDQDQLFGEFGDDVVYGNMGNDTCDGGEGADTVRGGQGGDVLTGGAGNDWLSGDLGDDTVTGGAGADTFNSWGAAGIDRVTDFNRAEGDLVRLEPGSVYTVRQDGADAVVEIQGGGQLVLVGVDAGKLAAGWIVVG